MTFFLVLSRSHSFSHRFPLKMRRRKLTEINKSVFLKGVIKVFFFFKEIFVWVFVARVVLLDELKMFCNTGH